MKPGAKKAARLLAAKETLSLRIQQIEERIKDLTEKMSTQYMLGHIKKRRSLEVERRELRCQVQVLKDQMAGKKPLDSTPETINPLLGVLASTTA